MPDSDDIAVRGHSEPRIDSEVKDSPRPMHVRNDTPSVDPVSLPSGHHIPQNFQSLLMHREAVRLILEDPSLILRALATLARWTRTGNDRPIARWERWQRILERKDWDLAVSDSEIGRQLRQASPLSTLLPQETRLEIIARVRRMQEAGE